MPELPEKFEDHGIFEPKSWEDYVPLGRWLIYKKLLIALFVLVVLLAALVAYLLLKPKPEPETHGIPVYFYLDEMLKLYSGEVIIINEADRVIYRGQVENGLRSGWGKDFFAVDEALRYEGEFRGDVYCGQGRLFGDAGELIYQGQFADGVYNGKGTLYDGGRKRYEGGFATGLYDGEGVLYDDAENVRYTGGFARGLREGAGLETDESGFPVYEGEFRGGLYDGNGVLFTSGGARLKFEGAFVKGKPTRSGKIFNLQGRLLYDGAVLDGKVDCLGLPGLSAAELKECVLETPVVYYDGGSVGYLYGELGLSAIGVYSVDTDDEIESESKPEPLDDGVILYTILLDGARYQDQISLDTEARSEWDKIPGFEAFMSSRLLTASDPAAPAPDITAKVKRLEDNIYEVPGLPETVGFDGKGFYRDLISYYWGGENLSKGGVPGVIHCKKRQFGG